MNLSYFEPYFSTVLTSEIISQQYRSVQTFQILVTAKKRIIITKMVMKVEVQNQINNSLSGKTDQGRPEH